MCGRDQKKKRNKNQDYLIGFFYENWVVVNKGKEKEISWQYKEMQTHRVTVEASSNDKEPEWTCTSHVQLSMGLQSGLSEIYSSKHYLNTQ